MEKQDTANQPDPHDNSRFDSERAALRTKLEKHHQLFRDLELALRQRGRLQVALFVAMLSFLLLCLGAGFYLVRQFNRHRFQRAMTLAAADIGDSAMREAPYLSEKLAGIYLNALRLETARTWPKIIKTADKQYQRLEKYISSECKKHVRGTSKKRRDKLKSALVSKLDPPVEDEMIEQRLVQTIGASIDSSLIRIAEQRLAKGRESVIEGFASAMRISNSPQDSPLSILKDLNEQLDKFAEHYGDGFVTSAGNPSAKSEIPLEGAQK